MAHKTMVGGTAYEITGGKSLLDGTAYTIKNGKTLVDGTAYGIGFVPTVQVIVTDTSFEIINCVYYRIDSSPNAIYLFHETVTWSLPVGTVIEIVCVSNLYSGGVYLNGTLVSNAPSTESEEVSYKYTVKEGVTVTIKATFEYADAEWTQLCGVAYITET